MRGVYKLFAPFFHQILKYRRARIPKRVVKKTKVGRLPLLNSKTTIIPKTVRSWRENEQSNGTKSRDGP